MKLSKKIIAVVIAALMAISMMPITALADEPTNWVGTGGTLNADELKVGDTVSGSYSTITLSNGTSLNVDTPGYRFSNNLDAVSQESFGFSNYYTNAVLTDGVFSNDSNSLVPHDGTAVTNLWYVVSDITAYGRRCIYLSGVNPNAPGTLNVENLKVGDTISGNYDHVVGTHNFKFTANTYGMSYYDYASVSKRGYAADIYESKLSNMTITDGTLVCSDGYFSPYYNGERTNQWVVTAIEGYDITIEGAESVTPSTPDPTPSGATLDIDSLAVGDIISGDYSAVTGTKSLSFTAYRYGNRISNSRCAMQQAWNSSIPNSGFSNVTITDGIINNTASADHYAPYYNDAQTNRWIVTAVDSSSVALEGTEEIGGEVFTPVAYVGDGTTVLDLDSLHPGDTIKGSYTGCISESKQYDICYQKGGAYIIDYEYGDEEVAPREREITVYPEYAPIQNGVFILYGDINCSPYYNGATTEIWEVVSANYGKVLLRGTDTEAAPATPTFTDGFVVNGTTRYDTIAEAIEAASAGDTITMLEDVSGSVTINKSLTIEGGNHTISASTKPIIITTAAKNVTINETNIEATATNKTGRAIWIGNDGSDYAATTDTTITFTDCDIKTTQRGIYFNGDNNQNVTLNVIGSTISATNGITNYDQQLDNQSNTNNSRGINLYDLRNSTVNITNSTVQGFHYGVNLAKGGDSSGLVVNITGSTLKGRGGLQIAAPNTTTNVDDSHIHGINTFSGAEEGFGAIKVGVDAANTVLNINDTEFTAYMNEAALSTPTTTQAMLDVKNSTSTVTVTGDTTYITAYGEDNTPVVQNYTTYDSGIAISSGTYASGSSAITIPEKYLASGVTQASTGKVIEIESSTVAIIGETQYDSLEAAVAAASAGDTIKLVNDIDFTSTYAKSVKHQFNIAGVTLDMGGHTITANNASIVFTGDNLTIKNGNFVGVDTAKSDGRASYGIFIYPEEGNSSTDTVSNSTEGAVLENLNIVGGINAFGSDVTVKGCDVEGTHFYAVYANPYAHITVESGNFTLASTGNSALGTAYTENPSKPEGTIDVTGGNFTIATGKNVVLPASAADHVCISGGTFKTSGDAVATVPAKYIKVNYAQNTTTGTVYQAEANNGASITVADTISENFYLDDEFYGATAYVTVNYNHNSNVSEDDDFRTDIQSMASLPELDDNTSPYDGARKLSVIQAPAQSTEPITIKVYATEADANAGTNAIDTITYSVYNYCRQILDGDYEADLKELAETTLDYAAAAQTYFNYNTDNMATVDATGDFYNNVADADFSSVPGVTAAPGCIKRVSIVVKSDLEINLYSLDPIEVTGKSIEADAPRFNAETGEKNGDYYVVHISGIDAANMNKTFTVTTSEGPVTMTANTVIKMMAGSSNAKLSTLAKAMYLYGVAASAYFD